MMAPSHSRDDSTWIRLAVFQGKDGNKLEFGHYTVGVRPDPEDGYPILGSTGLEGLDLAVMHSGVTNAALVGELLAKKILYGIEDQMLKDYRMDRTPEEREEFYERQRLWGTNITRLEQTDLAVLESQVDEAQFSLVKWGLHVPEEGTIEAYAAAAKLIAHAQSLGTKVLKESVTGFLKNDKGRVSGVVTGSGHVRGSHVVLFLSIRKMLQVVEKIQLRDETANDGTKPQP
ncbi:hypothetical protein FOMG_18700 [Fusarium oxysporum f. sp. melonis 26406]|uniref:FAD dependent oxidoreductase domain-containing protein n=1 Tax=Fusarium oxysporum f. sp. melonis 26406 TaxID=1089452 RepID=W9YYG6_FUSOX|nr:hypothetical protein FOMG_18700 [Fusarium oxysporum f. sp. melonis 26406]